MVRDTNWYCEEMSRFGQRCEDFNEVFSMKLRQLRRDAGLSQSALADELGVDQATVSRVEANDRRLNVGEAFVWLEALGSSEHEAAVLLVSLWAEYGSRPISLWTTGEE